MTASACEAVFQFPHGDDGGPENRPEDEGGHAVDVEPEDRVRDDGHGLDRDGCSDVDDGVR